MPDLHPEMTHTSETSAEHPLVVVVLAVMRQAQPLQPILLIIVTSCLCTFRMLALRCHHSHHAACVTELLQVQDPTNKL